MRSRPLKKAGALRRARKQWLQVFTDPARKGLKAYSLESKEHGQGDHFAWPQAGLAMFGHGFHRLVYLIEQLTDKVFGSHAELLGLQVCGDLQLEDDAWLFSRTLQASSTGYYVRRPSRFQTIRD
jgi:hypothetical protein